MAADIVQANRPEKIEACSRAPLHLLVLNEQGVRSDGETIIEGLPRSTLKDLRRKLTFVPAGHGYREWRIPRGPTRVTYFHIDTAKFQPPLEPAVAEISFAPRVFFEDTALWLTATKLKALIENAGAEERLYLEAIALVLIHEIMRLGGRRAAAELPARGGLAAWQQRIAVEYIEANVSEEISLTMLAKLARLSPHHFCRAFKQSFGIPPHRYHRNRRIENAKRLLALPALSITEIGLNIGYSETSAFTAAFRRATGLTPTGYRQILA
ncbi:MAG: helix-turn-helix transcriptional regulator [Acetobacteraceae bacterium]|nr:helix-turn-helix transcriptional regulator [Acetobacteraceae bacterium]MBV8524058.1 helix-turn-helix transcriptional regulator [Acetobacteraceae bacterium]